MPAALARAQADTTEHTSLVYGITYYRYRRQSVFRRSLGGVREMPTDPRVIERPVEREEEVPDTGIDGPYVVILYNDDVHDMQEVASQIQKATGYNIARCVHIMLEAHT